MRQHSSQDNIYLSHSLKVRDGWASDLGSTEPLCDDLKRLILAAWGGVYYGVVYSS